MAKTYSNLDLVNNCDAFPYEKTQPEQYAAYMKDVLLVEWSDSADASDTSAVYPIGYMRRAVFDALVAISPAERQKLGLDPDVDLQAAASASGTVPLHRLLRLQTTEPARTVALDKLNQYWRAADAFKFLRGWRDEPWPVYGRTGELLFSVERAAAGLLGVVRYGVHLSAYVVDPTTKAIKIWVPRRAANKSTYPSMLDNTVAGGLMTGEDPFECVVREADEEASLPEAVVRAAARPIGIITYVYITDERAGGEAGYIYPECEWVYDLPLPATTIPQPKDGEVESFMLCTVDEVRAQLAQGLYKPNCAVVLLDFMVRHGLLTRDNEPDYDAIVSRLHRVLPFPGPHHKETKTT
ncbi:hypothetical protein SPBR_02962 [Sporothrix brasiliensis 5110]|uniref:Nudix hydrolase domain-containing protein n=1 Tax=Sporothrix brasiliensis 5110 TaxID=1398154 RepID=A0A0C2F255_9PEZI|nr:uncharacterized protein SPBR_02962 [Sporothrix brasiliensis 5110]KIH93009.1 hypothetical protein SPBR_02962 [Sporothrix brasiliensis 5110]